MLDRTASCVASTIVALVAMLTLGGCSCEEPRANVVVVVIDTLRADHLGCYGYERPTSPQLDRLAAEGVLFENAFASSSWTAPSIASLFTSLHPSAHGVTTFNAALPAAVATLPEILHQDGFRTAGLSANFVHIIGRKGFARGFEIFEELRRPARDGEAAEFVGLLAADAETVTTRALAAAAAMRGAPFFLYVHYMDPHSGYTPPEPFRSRFVRPYDGPFDGGTEQLKRVMQGEMAIADGDMQRLVDLYDAEIAYTDAEIGRLFDGLRDLDVFDGSVVAVLSDHGEEFGDHGGVFHGVTLYEEMTRVPLLLRLPRGRHAGTRVASVVSLVDLGPTLIELAGADDERSTQGVSFAGRIADEPPSAAAGFAFSELHPDPPIEQALRARRHRTAIASRAWSYIGVGDRGAELYDRAADPRQQHDRAGEQPLVSAAFANELATFAEANRKHGAGEAPQVPLGERDRQQLRALGYLE